MDIWRKILFPVFQLIFVVILPSKSSHKNKKERKRAWNFDQESFNHWLNFTVVVLASCCSDILAVVNLSNSSLVILHTPQYFSWLITNQRMRIMTVTRRVMERALAIDSFGNIWISFSWPSYFWNCLTKVSQVTSTPPPLFLYFLFLATFSSWSNYSYNVSPALVLCLSIMFKRQLRIWTRHAWSCLFDLAPVSKLSRGLTPPFPQTWSHNGYIWYPTRSCDTLILLRLVGQCTSCETQYVQLTHTPEAKYVWIVL